MINLKNIFLSACFVSLLLGSGLCQASFARSYVIVNVQNQSSQRGPYTIAVARQIKKTWKKPSTKENKIVDFSFNITKAGSIKDLKTVESSGFETYDQTAKEAIEKSAPFPKLPSEFGESVTVDITFRSTKD